MTERPSSFVPLRARFLLTMFDILTKIAICRDGTVNRRFLSSFMPCTSASPKPKNKVLSSDLTLDSSRNLWIRIFAPSIPQETGEKLPLIVYFHGGGFAFMSPATSIVDAWCRRICSEIHAVVISVNYRLAPEFKFPAPYDDGIDVLRFLDSGQIDFDSIGILSNFQVDLSSCWLAGENSGGNIVHHVARRWAATVGSWDKVKIKGIIPIQPLFGGEKRTDGEIMKQGQLPMLKISKTDWFWKSFLPAGADRNHGAAHVLEKTVPKLEEAFPPVLLVVGDYDILIDWQLKYYIWLKFALKRDVKLVQYSSIHGFYAFPEYKESKMLIEEMKFFIMPKNSC